MKKIKEHYFEDCENILHIGGHKGQEGKIYKEMGKQFTFVEPVPKFADYIRGLGYHVVEKAVSSRDGTVDFHVAEVTERSSLREAPEDVMVTDKIIPVRCTTLKKIQSGYD